MSKKHFISSDASALIIASLCGVAACHPGLVISESDKIIYRPPTVQKVTLLSGGGSGHEPAHAGYVGEGMLDAAVCGEVFASPNARQITTGLEAVASDKGTLVIVKNYTGDRLNFALAVERARAQGRKIETVTVGDDVAVGREKGSLVGRRGLAGTVLVHKVAGAAAEKGRDLKNVTELALHVANNLATAGASLGHCTIPGREAAKEGKEVEEVAGLEIGTGIHNEPGYKRINPIPPHPVLIAELLSLCLDTTDTDRSYLLRKPQDKVVLLVNNLGGLSNLELNVLVGETLSQLNSTYGITPARVFAGAYVTSLDMPGFSITLLNLPVEGDITPQTVLELLDAYTSAVGWNGSIKSAVWTAPPTVVKTPTSPSKAAKHKKKDLPTITSDPTLTFRILASIHSQVSSAEPSMTHFDTLVGDGDCGTTLFAGAESLLTALINTFNLVECALQIATTIETSMGGTSGALYGIFFSAFATGLKLQAQAANQAQAADEDLSSPPTSPIATSMPAINAITSATVSFAAIATASRHALDTLMKYTPARVGDRTLMDALIPFVEAIQAHHDEGAKEALRRGLEAAEKGYEATRKMKAKLGRASYVNAVAFEGEGVPDPGALGVVAVIRGILEGVEKEERGGESDE